MSMTIEQVVGWFDDRAVYTPDPVAKEMCKIAADALREKAERENPKPLTFDELLQMDGEMVWLEVIDKSNQLIPDESAWVEVCIPQWKQTVWFWMFGNECEFDPHPKTYGKTHIACRHKPKGE